MPSAFYRESLVYSDILYPTLSSYTSDTLHRILPTLIIHLSIAILQRPHIHLPHSSILHSTTLAHACVRPTLSSYSSDTLIHSGNLHRKSLTLFSYSSDILTIHILIHYDTLNHVSRTLSSYAYKTHTLKTLAWVIQRTYAKSSLFLSSQRFTLLETSKSLTQTQDLNCQNFPKLFSITSLLN